MRVMHLLALGRLLRVCRRGVNMDVYEIIKKYEVLVLKALAVMMAIVVLLALIDLAWFLVQFFIAPPFGLVEIGQLLEIFGMFLLVLIGIELMETILTYQQERLIRVEVALVVAMLAVSRKIITLKYSDLTTFTLLEVGVLVLALAAAFYVLRVSRRHSSVATRKDQTSAETTKS
jgi:uncharacterized membrane protein (DUF373 family)